MKDENARPASDVHAGHRERLKKRAQEVGLTALPPHEVIELLLFYAVPRQDVNELAHALIDRFETVTGVLSAGEEELNLGKVTFDEDLFLAFMKGYLKEAGSFMTDAERAYLYDAIRLLPFELGLRFFQDYLAGDRYFKVRQPGQNLNRARVQFRLCEAIEARERSIREILRRF